MDVFAISLLSVLPATAFGNVVPNIVGGSDAVVGEFPWQGSLQVQSGSTWIHICGCVLYSYNKALTAAHCLSGSASSYRIGFGLHNINSENGTEQYSTLLSYIIHPDFNSNIGGLPNDIAVLRSTANFDVTDSAVGTIQLASGSSDFIGQSCIMSGWGRLSGGGPTPDILQKVNMTILDNTDCSSRFSEISGADIIDGHICTLESEKSACSSDDGGPLVCGNTLAGTISWGINSCTGSLPTVFSRVSYFYSWIANQ